ncbi:MAG TPA: GNAT family N-acetyltransferase [Streptosporangiaceae bacterium]|nr:GNAT family N-acetyltransferase [Streptosporangiaceae bacterium]
MDRAAVIAAFNQQVRRNVEPDGTGATYEDDGIVVRRLAPPGQHGSGVFWSGLDAGSADTMIADQVALFGRRGDRFEWKLYSFDAPADLAQRLLAAGFVPEDDEAFMVAAAAAVSEALRPAVLPDGVSLEHVSDAAGIERLIGVHEQLFRHDESELRQALLAQFRADPETVGLVVANAGGQPVCAARIEFLHGTEFAGLWGGGTLPQWRGRGIYRALVRYRAELAVQRGYRYLTVDASDQSRPILERVGFTALATTTPYIWSPRR